jgi:murein L,D-transpeptidase YafK
MNYSTLIALGLLSFPAHAGDMDSRAMESMLVKSLNAVGSNKLDTALNEVETILKANPNFKLAQMLKGDLLMARAKPLNGFGNDPDAPADKVNDLRDEARVRLQRVQQQPLTAPPRFIWQLNEKQHYAIVVDTSKSTLYLYENDHGTPRYVENFYISVGKKGADKLSEGDQKTPLGVYFVNAHLNKNQLTDFYGSDAYPINYPNEWDVREGRNGHGIWLHGTPSNTFSRPPLASNGCVVLTNNDLAHVGKLVQVGTTPVIITNHMEALDDSARTDQEELRNAIEQWRNDWASRNTDAYLKHYAKDFASGSFKFDSWAAQKRLVNSGKTWIKVNLSDISMFAYPTQPGLVVVNFEQDYSSNNLNNSMKKRQYWIKRDNRWQIVYEGAAS